MVTHDEFERYVARNLHRYREHAQFWWNNSEDIARLRELGMSEEAISINWGVEDVPWILLWNYFAERSLGELGIGPDDVAIVLVPDGDSRLCLLLDDGLYSSPSDFNHYRKQITFHPFKMEGVDMEEIAGLVEMTRHAAEVAERSRMCLSRAAIRPVKWNGCEMGVMG